MTHVHTAYNVFIDSPLSQTYLSFQLEAISFGRAG